jgi:putative addiction module antidote
MNDARSELGSGDSAIQIRKIGNSIGIVLPKEFVSRFDLREGDRLYPVQQPDGSLRLVPYDPKHAKAMDIARKMMREYRETFAALAKS